ncbi:hypothetical protein ACFPMF_17935 [Larkinella bovis]|uniref:Uncharacterized protein n=1 Tax=Larkinella bovis TaxID=683041 RepID=A0ABW0IGE5_9BACT
MKPVFVGESAGVWLSPWPTEVSWKTAVHEIRFSVKPVREESDRTISHLGHSVERPILLVAATRF